MADTNAAAMATLFGQWFEPDAHLDYPKGGSAAVVDALVRGLESHGGSLRTGATVERLRLEGQRVVGVTLTSGEQIDAEQVISNADIWTTLDLLPADALQRLQPRPCRPLRQRPRRRLQL